jgi:hypothetical protein
MHTAVHEPATQADVKPASAAGQSEQRAPHCAVESSRTQAAPQGWKPLRHVKLHPVGVHEGMAFGGAVQAHPASGAPPLEPPAVLEPPAEPPAAAPPAELEPPAAPPAVAPPAEWEPPAAPPAVTPPAELEPPAEPPVAAPPAELEPPAAPPAVAPPAELEPPAAPPALAPPAAPPAELEPPAEPPAIAPPAAPPADPPAARPPAPAMPEPPSPPGTGTDPCGSRHDAAATTRSMAPVDPSLRLKERWWSMARPRAREGLHSGDEPAPRVSRL